MYTKKRLKKEKSRRNGRNPKMKNNNHFDVVEIVI